MFAIYDTRGRRFRDMLGNLRKVQAPQATTGMKLLTNISEEETIPFSTPGKGGENALSSKALQAYRDIRHLNQREPIYHAHQLMSHPVTTVSMDMDILAARRFLQQQKFQQIPVINNQHQDTL